MKSHKVFMGCVFALIGLFGVACLGLGFRASIERANFDRIAVTTQGHISRIEKTYRWGDTRSVGTPKAYISYAVGGQAYEEPSNYSDTNMVVGQAVTFKYDPSNPIDIRVDRVPALPIFFFGFGAFVLTMLFVAVKVTFGEKPRKNQTRPKHRDIDPKIEKLFLKRTAGHEED